jgi:CRP-like cAMP-binding protein
MSGKPSPRPLSGTRFAPGDGNRVVSPKHAPVQNDILAALPPEDYERVLPALEPVPLHSGWMVHGAGDPQNHLYFIAEGIITRMFVTENGESAGFAVAGKEGVIGIATFLGGTSTPNQALVTSPGYAYKLKADLLMHEFDEHFPLRHWLLRYTQALVSHAGQSAVCNRLHSIEQQLCRWILSCLDRLPSNELTMTQDLISKALGVRREGVTEAAGRLQKAGLIQYGRGKISVLDRPRMETQVCECYGVVKREYDRLRDAEIADGQTRVRVHL